MELTSTIIEKELKGLAPASVSNSLLDRLDAAMSSACAEVGSSEEKVIVASADPGLAHLEESLRGLAPYGVPEDMIARLDEAMSRWHEEVPESEKVIQLRAETTSRQSSWLRLRSVAAVGILGAGVAFFTSGQKPATMAQDQSIPVLTNGYTSPAAFSPHDARTSLISANDRGVVWTKGGKPVHCLEVQVNHKVQFINEQGDKLTFERPKKEMRFTTVKFD